jgi:PKD repeat protein
MSESYIFVKTKNPPMRKISLLFVVFLLASIALSAENWININSSTPAPAKVRLVSSTIDNSVVNFSFGGFAMKEVQTPKGTAYSIRLGNSTPLLATGAPDLPKLTASLVIPDHGGMSAVILSSSYKDFPGIDIAPSKGIIFRNQDPSAVPYTYGKAYSTDKFYPGNVTDTREPFILRDFRGQTLVVQPFQYNPVTRTLRVFYEITVELRKTSATGLNTFDRPNSEIRVNREFSAMYSRQFLNFDNCSYVPLGEYGKILVICHDAFMPAMQPFVTWKNQCGFPTKMVGTSVAGTTSAAIKSYIANYYNTNGISFVLLVGDNAQVPTDQEAGLGGPSDNAFGFITGNDHFPEIFIGRFSAENIAQVQTQVQRSMDYEKNPSFLTNDWFTSVIGIGSDQGPGDDGEYDYQHIRNLQSQLLSYTYTWNPELFDGSQGGNDAPGNPTPALVSSAVNDGASLILYCGHGSETSWGTTGFSNTNVNALTNQGKLPFVWSVACVNGAFMNTTCFAEAWLRASQGGQPTGAVAFLGSTINQSWNSPMDGQDEMVSILSETYPSNIKRTFAGLSINGCMKMIDSYGTDGQNMADTWTVFGDPTLMIRTDNPETMTVTHDAILVAGASTLAVICNVNGARATLSIGDSILCTMLVANNTAVLSFPPVTTPGDTARLTVTDYNHIPYLADIPIIPPSGPFLIYSGNTVNDATGNNNGLLDYGEDVLFSVSLKNAGIAATGTVTSKLRTTDPYIALSDSTESYGIIDAGQTKTATDGFRFHAINTIPDGHAIPFKMISTDGTNTWNSFFTVTAHAPVMAQGNYMVIDSAGNNNGQLDPGETAFIKVFVNNGGSSDATNVTGHLLSVNPLVTVTPDTHSYGTIAGGNGAFQLYQVTVDASAGVGSAAPFLMEIAADKGVTGSGSFTLVIGKIPVLIVDFDLNNNSGPVMKQSLDALGIPSDYKTTAIPDTLSRYASVLVCLGVYPDNTVLSSTDGQKLADFLTAGGRLYMEGGDTWKFDPATSVHPMFHIDGIDDGSGDLGTIQGYTGTFTSGMSFPYTGDNQYIDHIAPQTGAFPIFENLNPVYDNAVAYDAGSYKTIGSSFEFGGLSGEGAYPSTKNHLMQEYLTFFGIPIPPLAANFQGYPTYVSMGQNVEFYDYTTGGATIYHWSFPGGTPSTSTDRNPVVTYNTVGVYDVQLIVSNGQTSDTLVRSQYIWVDYPMGTGYTMQDAGCRIMPNPCTGSFQLLFTSDGMKMADIRVTNSLGNPVYSADGVSAGKNASIPVNLGDVPEGVYFVTVTAENGISTRKVVIQR